MKKIFFDSENDLMSSMFDLSATSENKSRFALVFNLFGRHSTNTAIAHEVITLELMYSWFVVTESVRLRYFSHDMCCGE